MEIFKQPHIGGEVLCRTDHTFSWTEPQSVVGFWFAIDDATTENGCLWVKPGGHRLPARSRFRRTAPDAPTTLMEVLDPAPYPVDDIDGTAVYPRDNWLLRADDMPMHGFADLAGR